MSRRPPCPSIALLCAPLLALAACAGTPADEAAPRPASAPSAEAVPADAMLVRPFEDDGRTQRERDLQTVGRTGG